VPRHIIVVERGGHTAFVKGGTESLNQGIDILGREKLAVTTDARGVIEEGNETGLDGDALDLDIRAVEGVGLPHFIGVGLGKGQPVSISRVGLRLEHFILVDQAVEGGAGNLGAGQQALLDAQAIEQRAFGSAAMDFGQHGINGFLNDLRANLTGLALVGTGFVFHDGNAVLAVAAQPGGDGTPSELARLAILVGEGHLADGLDPLSLRIALGHVHGSEHAHFQVNGGISHNG